MSEEDRDKQCSSAESDGCLSAEDREALDQVYIAHLKKEIERLRALPQALSKTEADDG